MFLRDHLNRDVIPGDPQRRVGRDVHRDLVADVEQRGVVSRASGAFQRHEHADTAKTGCCGAVDVRRDDAVDGRDEG
jgi:hypothetical protein